MISENGEIGLRLGWLSLLKEVLRRPAYDQESMVGHMKRECPGLLRKIALLGCSQMQIGWVGLEYRARGRTMQNWAHTKSADPMGQDAAPLERQSWA